MKKNIFFSNSLIKTYKLVRKDLDKFLQNSGFKVGFELLKADACPSEKKHQNAMFVISEKDLKDAFYAKKKNLVIFRKSLKVERRIGRVFLPLPNKTTASRTALIIATFLEDVLYASLYEDTLKSLTAFESYADLSRSELLSMRQVLEAQEKLQEYNRAEHMQKEDIIKAHERVSDLSRIERLSYDKVLQAWEIFSELIRKELIESRKESSALERVLELSNKERKDNEQTIDAMDKTIELSRKERIESESTFKAEENVMEFNRVVNIDDNSFLDNVSESELQAILKNEAVWNSLAETDQQALISIIKALFKILLKRKHSSGLNS